MKSVDLLKKFIKEIGTNLELDHVLRIICKELLDFFKVDRVMMGKFKSTNDYSHLSYIIEFTRISSIPKYSDQLIPIEVSEYLGKTLFEEGKDIIVDNIDKANVPKFYREFHYKFGTKSILNTPIKKDGDKWGILGIFQNSQYREWTKNEIKFLHLVIDYIYVAIRQAELYSSTQKLAEREKVLREIISSIRSTLDVNDLKNKIVTEIGKVFEADRCVIMQYDQVNQKFLKVDKYSQYLISDEVDSHIEFNLEDSNFEVFKELFLYQKKELLLADVANSNPNINTRIIEMLKNLKIKSNYTVLITYGDQFYGILYLNFIKNKKVFTEDEINFFRTLANQSGIAIHQAELYHREKQAVEREKLISDILTKSISTFDINQIKQIVKAIGINAKADRCYFVEVDLEKMKGKPIDANSEYRSSSEIKSIVGYDFPTEDVQKFVDLYLNKRDLVVFDYVKFKVENKTQYAGIIKYSKTFNLKSGIGIPFIYMGKLTAILAIEYVNEKIFLSDEELNFLRILGNQIGMAYNQIQLYQNTKQQAEIQNAILNNIPYMAWLKDKNGILLAVNKEYAKMCNTTIENIIGKTDFDFFTKEHADSYIREDCEVMRTKQTISTEDLITGAEGTRLHESFKSPVFNDKGKVIGTVGISRDITENKKSELELLHRQELIIKSNEREKLLRKIIEKIRSSLDINETLSYICDEVAKLFDVQRATIAEFYDKNDRSKFIPRREYKKNKHIIGLKNVNYPKEAGAYIGENVLDKEIDLVFDNVSESNVPVYFKNIYAEMKVKSILCTSIKKGEDKWGIIILAEYYRYRHWTEEEINLLKTISYQIYIAIKQAELYSTTKQQAEREKSLSNIITAIRSTIDISEMKSLIVSEIGKFFNADRCNIVEIDSQTLKTTLIKEGEEYLSSPQLKSLVGYDWEKGEIRKCYEIVVVQKKELHGGNSEDFFKKYDLPEINQNFYKNYDIKSSYDFPILYDDETIGALLLHFTQKDVQLSEDNLNFLRTLVNQVGIALYQARLYTKEKRTAKREALLRNTIEILRSTLNSEEIKKYFVELVCSYFGADRCLFSDHDKNTGKSLPIRIENLKFTDIRSLIGVSAENEFPEFVAKIKKGKNIIIKDLKKTLSRIKLTNYKAIKTLSQNEVKSNYGFLVKYKDQIMGVLILDYVMEKRVLTHDELDFLKVLRDQAGVALYQAQLFEEIQEIAEKERILREIITELKLIQNIEDAFNYLISKIANIYNVSRTILIEIPLQESKKARIAYEYVNNKNIQSVKDAIFPDACQEMFKDIINSFSPVVVEDTTYLHCDNTEVQNFFKTYSIKAFIGSPLVRYNHETKLLGILFICSDKPRNWSEYEINLLKSINESVVNVIWEILKTIEVNKLRDTFVTTLAHDLQVPIVGDITALQFLSSRPDTQIIGKFKNLINETIINDKRILTILKSLLDSYEYESSKKKLKLIKTDLMSLINNSVYKIKNIAESKAISIETNISDNLPKVNVDKDELAKILFIILDNAINYSPNGSHIIINSKYKNNNVITQIIDNGPGIPEHIRDLIFKRYEMAIEIERKIGAGISLYLAKQIVEAHNGKIWFYSEEGKGTTFCFSLPIT